MGCTRSSRFAALALLACLAVAGCARDDSTSARDVASAPADTAPPPPEVPQADPTAAPTERASSPTLQPVAMGKFDAANQVAEAATGAIDIQDNRISGSNGAVFETERVALVSADDQYTAGARYADAMLIEPRQQVELRHVLEETPPSDTAGMPFCGTGKTGYLALAQVMEGDAEVIKMIALSGQSLPAASASGVSMCGAAQYHSPKK